MVPVYVCDDVKETREYLAQIIRNLILIHGYDMEVVLVTGDPEEVLEHRKNHKLRSIYFFDVDLQHEVYDGFTLAKEIRKFDTRGFLIFVTTHEEMIFETFKYRLEAMSYLYKDVPEKLNQQLKDCLKEVNYLLSQEVSDRQSYYTVKMAESSYQIPLAEILFFETATGHRIILHTESRMLEFRGNLKKIEEELPEGFLKIHRSFLVQTSKIQQVNYADNTVVMKNGSVCLMSRSGKKMLKQLFEGGE
ncbi:two-component system response regulator AgrA [Enterococcus sp. PF1-24]|uniref:LytR/AlgR family response regulator transcription factor n=1 Tax=unclassified Enterococcus TaxID=2608891 RepID=UPI0024756EBC|nr:MULTISPECIES: LytTR family DNA-binding domain-containing protein [unclassified Enterococcus]MDH6363736.1 two-component system response regulator AgrA [Enterococcus sp. PFB1-1]MDH6400692.1 two-component system response regulator AgrA [Enterococcus sp. PF1-24]